MLSFVKRSALVAMCVGLLSVNLFATLNKCTNGCNMGSTWLLNGKCWTVDINAKVDNGQPPVTTCCDFGSWGLGLSGGIANKSGTIDATNIAGDACTAECPNKNNKNGVPDSKASVNSGATLGTMTMPIDKCFCGNS